MQVFDEITGKLRSRSSCRLAIVGHLPEQLIFGFINKEEPVDEVLFFNKEEGFIKYNAVLSKLKDVLVFSNFHGYYMSRVDVPEDILIKEMYTKGRGMFPYHFERKYEACENFVQFDGKQRVLDTEKTHCLAGHLKYTFGLEFETSQGYVPENICYRDGLIPLRDGSISGIEYSTVILSGNKGINLLEQQLESLRQHTNFNKECSLHIHLGGFPLNDKKIFNLYRLCKYLEPELSRIVPPYTFKTSQYKANHKDYCNKLPSYRNFDQMYEHLVGRRFFNDFTQPHPNDIRREAKWHISTRYYWINFINALCYDVNKTIEFRFLRPTYNFQKIILWLYILNAIMCFAENHMDKTDKISLNSIIRRIYPKEIAERVIIGICKLSIIVENQLSNGDLIGQDIYMEEEMFSEDLGL